MSEQKPESIIRNLNKVAEDSRDDDWYVEMLDTIPEARYVLAGEEPVRAPDGFYYFYVSLPPEDYKGPLVSFDKKMIDECLDRVAGIVIYPDLKCEKEPVWILSYGELHSFKNFDSFAGDPADLQEIFDREENPAEIEEEAEVLIAAPSAEFIHPGARKFLKSFFDALGFAEVGIALMIDPREAPSKALVLSLQPEDFETPGLLEDFQHMLSWLLVPNRSVMLDPGLEAEDFHPLV